ncbi:MAG: hypothetical protein HRT36_08810 [Alphaproteobacteria bacterium]|nr:hypothetical protein [Alphaproteobacteria bacterium]
MGAFDRQESVLDQVMKSPEMLGSILARPVRTGRKSMRCSISLVCKFKHRDQGYLEADFEQRDFLLDHAARFDRKLGHWYIPNNVDAKPFKDIPQGFILTDGKYHIPSHKLPGLDAESLQQTFGLWKTTSPPPSKANKGYRA